MERPPTLVGIASAAVLAGGLLLILRQGAAHTPTAAAAPPPLTVTTRLPEWRAPGVRVVVGGFAASHERVVLRANGRTVAAATAGRFGRYAVRFAAERPGRYRLKVTGAGRSRVVGSLRVRRVVLDAVGDITFGEQVGPAMARHGAAYPWRYVAGTLARADVTTGNLETSV